MDLNADDSGLIALPSIKPTEAEATLQQRYKAAEKVRFATSWIKQ